MEWKKKKKPTVQNTNVYCSFVFIDHKIGIHRSRSNRQAKGGMRRFACFKHLRLTKVGGLKFRLCYHICITTSRALGSTVRLLTFIIILTLRDTLTRMKDSKRCHWVLGVLQVLNQKLRASLKIVVTSI